MALKPTTATIDGQSPRAETWRRLFGSLTVQIKSPIPTRAELPGLGVREIYEVDLASLSPEQIERIGHEMGKTFGLPAEEVMRDLQHHGLPIPAEDVTVAFDARLVL